MAQVFVSYKREDISEDFIKHLRQKLEDAGFDVWIDKELLLPGQDWKKEIDNAIKASIALIVIMTPEARKSEYVTYEWAFAVGRGIPVLPILLRETELHPRLNDFQFVDFTNAWTTDTDANWEKLITSLELEVAKANDLRLSQEPPLIIRRVIDEFDNPDSGARRQAIHTLESMLPNTAAIKAFQEAFLNHPLPDIRAASASALGTLKDDSQLSLLAGKLDDENPAVQSAIIKALGKIGSDNAFQIVLNAFDIAHKEPMLLSIVEVLGNFRHEDALPLLEQATKHKTTNIGTTAIIALAKIGTQKSSLIIRNAKDNFTENERGKLMLTVALDSGRDIVKILETSGW